MIIQIDRKAILDILGDFSRLIEVKHQTPEEKAKYKLMLKEMAEKWVLEGKTEKQIRKKLEEFFQIILYYSNIITLKFFSYSGTLKETLVIRC